MAKLLVTADVHGSYGTWLTLKSLLGPDDALVVAGDLFGTRFPHHGSPDYQPDLIRKELADFKHPLYFVYGNCDKPAFSPGYEENLTFQFMGQTIYLHHGHRPLRQLPFCSGIIIQGHTHVSMLDQDDKILFLNPGSLTVPRDGLFTYATINNIEINLINIKTKERIKRLPLVNTTAC